MTDLIDWIYSATCQFGLLIFFIEKRKTKMHDEMMQNIVAAIQPLAEQIPQSHTEDILEGMDSILRMYCETLKLAKPSKTVLQSMLALHKTYGKLSELQLIALSKEIKPADMELTDAQKKIRDQITKLDAVILRKAVDLEAIDGKFLYKKEPISAKKVKTAAEIARIFDDITVDNILDFSSILYESPYLSIVHPIGKKIFKGCKTLQEEYITCVGSDISFYRARKMKSEDTLFSDSEMRKAPFKIPGQGRFNTEGVARFYVSGSIEDAASEIIKHSTTNAIAHIQVAEYRAERILYVFDLGRMSNKLSEKCLCNVPNPDKFNTEYLLSGFLAQCLDYHKKVDGIKYGASGHELYVFFQDRYFRPIEQHFLHKDIINENY